MARIITALFDTRADADAGAERVRQAGIDAGHVTVRDQSAHADDHAHDTAAPANKAGIWDALKNAVLPHRDRHAYEEGVRRGGFLLTAQVADDKTPDAVAALEGANTVDLDARSEEWRAGGWEYPDDTLDAGDTTFATGTRDTEFGGTRYRAYRTEDY